MQFFPAYWQNNNNNYAEKKLRMNRNEISRVIVECFINFFKFCERNNQPSSLFLHMHVT